MRALSIFGLVMLLITASVNAYAYRLTYKDTPNAARAYQTNYAMKGELGMPGSDPMPFDSAMVLAWQEKVLAVKDGAATLALQFNPSNMTITLAGEKSTVAIPGAKLTFDRTALGKITNLKMEQTAENSSLTGINSTNPWQFLNQMGMTDQFPDKDLNFGETWTTTDKTEYLPGAVLEVKSVNKLVGAKTINGKQYLQIDSEITLNSPAHQVTISLMGMTMPMVISTQFTGKATSFFDEQAGQYFSATFSGKALNTVTTTDESVKVNSTATITGAMKTVPVPVTTTTAAK
ncbi:MAG: hypothetical protein ACYC7E_11615 [Armatimonadota bacterium]